MSGAGRFSADLGDLTIQRIVEFEAPFMNAFEMLPDLTPAQFEEHAEWLRADALDADDKFRLCFQSYVVRTPHHTILVDSCIGNHKHRSRPEWHMRSSSAYMDGLHAIGLTVEDIDYVMCTHLHVDHVGWNTQLVDGRWVPTFPNARYVFSKDEYDLRQAEARKGECQHFDDSLLPVVEAGRADLVHADFGIGDHLRLLPTPGHTPFHFAVELGRNGTDAVLTGDLLHVALQMRYPELSFIKDADPVMAARTRRAFLERFCETRTLCCTAHFVNRSAGLVRRWDDGFRLSDAGLH